MLCSASVTPEAWAHSSHCGKLIFALSFAVDSDSFREGEDREKRLYAFETLHPGSMEGLLLLGSHRWRNWSR